MNAGIRGGGGVDHLRQVGISSRADRAADPVRPSAAAVSGLPRPESGTGAAREVQQRL